MDTWLTILTTLAATIVPLARGAVVGMAGAWLAYQIAPRIWPRVKMHMFIDGSRRPQRQGLGHMWHLSRHAPGDLRKVLHRALRMLAIMLVSGVVICLDWWCGWTQQIEGLGWITHAWVYLSIPAAPLAVMAAGLDAWRTLMYVAADGEHILGEEAVARQHAQEDAATLDRGTRVVANGATQARRL